MAGNTRIHHGAEAMIVQALKNAGHEVIEVSYPTYANDYSHLNNILDGVIEGTCPDFVLCGKVMGVTAEFLKHLKERNKIPFIQWTFDKMTNFKDEDRTKWWFPQAKGWDLSMNAEDCETGHYNSIGIKHRILREGFDPKIFYPIEPTKEAEKKYWCDVMFAGHNYYKFRKDLCEMFQNLKEVKFRQYSELYTTALNKAGSVTKLSITTNSNDFEDAGWSSRLVQHMGMGLPVLSPHIPAMDFEGFIDKENIIYYDTRDLEDLKEKALFYLKPENEEKRKEIGKKAREMVMKHHTWEIRIKQLFEIMKEEGLL